MGVATACSRHSMPRSTGRGATKTKCAVLRTRETERTLPPVASARSSSVTQTPNEWTTKIYALSKRRHDVAVYQLIKNHLEWGYVRARMTIDRVRPANRSVHPAQ